MRINLKIPEEWNEERKKLNAKWITVIRIGLKTLQDKPIMESEKIPTAVEDHLKRAVQNLSSAWNLIKPFMKNQTTG